MNLVHSNLRSTLGLNLRSAFIIICHTSKAYFHYDLGYDCHSEHIGFPSVNVQAVCNDKIKFTQVFVDRAGSVHDARVLTVNPLGPLLQTNSIANDKYHLLSDGNLDIVVRLGGFHMLMSFLGSVGHLMKCSGLDGVMSVLFGPSTVEHVFGGKVYSRALHGHFIIYKALTRLLLDHLKFPQPVEEGDNYYLPSTAVLLGDGNHLCGSLTPDTVSRQHELYTKTLETN